MIIVRSPLRITLGGGGTDLPAYYEKYGGLAITAAIDKYVYITVHETFIDDLIIKYSELERVQAVSQIKHPIIREALAMLGMTGRSLEICSMADIPAGTGLGSSSSFTVALLAALHAARMDSRSRTELAEEACAIEIDRLGGSIGKQDQYSASFGSLMRFEFMTTGEVNAIPLSMPTQTINNLEDHLMLFFTGYSRSASDVLNKQRNNDDNLTSLKQIAIRTLKTLYECNLSMFAELLSEQWEHKKMRSAAASNSKIDWWYKLGMNNGALGGKLVGAGGGGFLMFYAENKRQLRDAMSTAGLREVRFRFDHLGTRVV